MHKQGIYIYGFLPSACTVDIEKVLGENGVYLIWYSDVVAVVSATEYERIEYMNKEELAHLLVDHQRMIERIMGCGCSQVIPMRLGSIVGSDDEVIQILKNGQDIITETFENIVDVEEVDVVVVWNNFADVIKEITEIPQVKSLKENIEQKGSFDANDGIAIGKLIKENIDQKNNEINLDIVDSLMPFCKNAKKHEAMNDEMPLNYAFLVYKEKSDLFISMIDKLDEKYGDKLNFKIVGPLPCYSFYTIECDLLKIEDVEKAKKILGIDLSNNEYDLKKAYRLKASLTHPDKQSDSDENDGVAFVEINNAYKLLIDYENIIKQSTKCESEDPLYLVKIRN
jgi:hypothetical protein